jgi:alpha-amylase
MGVMLQAFYWDCPKVENREHQWWAYIKSKLPAITQAGFTALWLPPANKAAGWKSMGYDPYDYYDLGEFDQKGGAPTWFGSKAELLDLIQSAHATGLQVYADLVFNHNSGGDAQELNPIDGQSRWTKFDPKSGKFPRDWRCFHPSQYETWDGGTFGDMPDLCHHTPLVYTELINCARWLLEEIGFDGFRYDMVKGYGGWMVRSIQELRALRGSTSFKPYAVGECWDSERTIDDWLDEANAWSDNPVGAFDFPLRWRLRDLCDSYGFSLRNRRILIFIGKTTLKRRLTTGIHDSFMTVETPRPCVQDRARMRFDFLMTANTPARHRRILHTLRLAALSCEGMPGLLPKLESPVTTRRITGNPPI